MWVSPVLSGIGETYAEKNRYYHLDHGVSHMFGLFSRYIPMIYSHKLAGHQPATKISQIVNAPTWLYTPLL